MTFVMHRDGECRVEIPPEVERAGIEAGSDAPVDAFVAEWHAAHPAEALAALDVHAAATRLEADARQADAKRAAAEGKGAASPAEATARTEAAAEAAKVAEARAKAAAAKAAAWKQAHAGAPAVTVEG